MKTPQASPFSSPKCQLPDHSGDEETRLRSRRQPPAVLDGSEEERALRVLDASSSEGPVNAESMRRAVTLPPTMEAVLAKEAERGSFPERRQRRNLSRVYKDDFPSDDLLGDSGKRVSCSSRNLKLTAVASERSMKALSLKRGGGRPATPLDIPFDPNRSFSRAVSAEPELDCFEEELEANKSDIRRTRTQIPPTYPTVNNMARCFSASDRPLRSERSLNSQKTNSTRNREANSSSSSSFSTDGNSELDCEGNDSAREFQTMKASTRKLESCEERLSMKRRETTLVSEIARTDSNRDENSSAQVEVLQDGSHTIAIKPPSRKDLQPKEKSSKRIFPSENKRDDVKSVDTEVPTPLTWWQLLFHYVSLLFVQYPFKHHRQWLDKMYKTRRLPRPENEKSHQEWTVSSLPVHRGGIGALPTLPEDSSSFRAPPRNARIRRRTQVDSEGDNDEFSMTVGINHNKRTSSIGGTGVLNSTTMPPNRPPLGHLPRSRNIYVEQRAKKKNRRSVEIFGDIMHALGLHPNAKGRLKLPHGISEMDETELTGFQARFYNFIKRHHKGRLARAWDHIIHPLDSMQKKHRRSTNKVRLLNAIDKHRAQKFENNYDMVKTKFFLCGQWFFEALTPPKYTKKPMLLTALFPLVLILFFGFMAGEYSYWRDQQGNKTDYEFGPVELSRWLLKSDPGRTFDDEFLIIWGARYLPRVTSESWRWLISMLVHESFAHLGGNILLFVILSWSLESKYGFWRTGLICWLSGLSGNFMSAAFEDSCGIVLGASGCVFGLAAFYIIDVAGDFRFVSFPCLRLLAISTFLCAFIIALTSHQEASHLSHIGGFLFGFCVSLVFVPRFIDERVEALLPWIAFIASLALLCVLPLVVFCSVLPNLECHS